MNDDRRAAIEKAINTPFLDDFPENTLRIRRNLLAASSIALFYKLGGLDVDPESVFLGIKLTGLTSTHIDIGFFIIVVYFWLHFFCNSFSYIHEFRLRATGAKMLMEKLATNIGAYDSGLEIDNIATDDPRQSTLLTWIDQHQTKLNDMIKKFCEVLQELEQDGDRNSDTIRKTLEVFQGEIKKIDMLKVGLEQFRSSFGNFLVMQSKRWLALELGLPIGVGIVALGVLIFR